MSNSLLCEQFKEGPASPFLNLTYTQLLERVQDDLSIEEERSIASLIFHKESTQSSDFLSTLSDHERAYLAKHPSAIDEIPVGDKCYVITKIESNGVDFPKIHTKGCPHAAYPNPNDFDKGVFCQFMGKSDEDLEGIGLLWDGIKECGIKDGVMDM